jgi:putative membrane protein
MKNSIFFKSALASASLFIMASCGGGNANSNAANDTTTTTKMADQKNDSAALTKADEKDAKALVDAYNGSLMEARLSDSVSAATKNDDVKSLATAMGKAHGGLNGKIEDLAAKKQITLPSDLSSSDKDKIISLTNEKQMDLNKDYVNKLISAHKDAISDFEKDSSSVSDNDIKMLFINTLPDLRMHLSMAQNCKAKMKEMK